MKKSKYQSVLKNLTIDGARTEQDFSPEIRAYYGTVPYETDCVKVTAEFDSDTYQVTIATVVWDTNTTEIPLFHEESITDMHVIGSGKAVTLLLREQGFTSFSICAQNSVTYEKNYTYINIDRGLNPKTAYKEESRPRYHYTPSMYYMNDPNGLIYNEVTGEYHLYHQYSGEHVSGYKDIADATVSWGHAVSKDMMNWKQCPIVLRPDELGLPFSGSAVIDYNNTSGLFDDSVAPGERIVAFISKVMGEDRSEGTARISLVYSKDGGYTFIPYKDNPVIKNPRNMYGGSQDPRVFWYEDDYYEQGGIWVAIISGETNFFVSEDLIDWEYCGPLRDIDGNVSDAECPDMFKLAVDGDPNNEKWVYTASGMYYYIGHFEHLAGKKLIFVSDTPRRETYDLRFSIVKNFVVSEPYAYQRFTNVPDGRIVSLNWLIDLSVWGDKIWNGAQTVPMENTLRTVGDEILLVRYPVKEVDSMRDGAPIFELNDYKVNRNSGDILQGLHGTCIDLVAEIALNGANTAGFSVRKGDGEEMRVYFDRKLGKMMIDKMRTQEPKTTHEVCGPYASLVGSKMMPKEGDIVQFRILLDQICFEVYGNGGEASYQGHVFCDFKNDGIEFFTDGEPTVRSLQVYNMKTMNRNWK